MYCTTCGATANQQAKNLLVCANGHQTWINAVPGASAYILRDGKVLFGIRSLEPQAGGLNIPGGFLDLGETAEAAAVREAKEEMGVDIRIVGYIGSYPSDYAGRQLINIVFVAEITGGVVAPGDDMKGGEPVWRNVNDLPTTDELAWDWQVPAMADLRKWYKRTILHQ